jgi:hypothetical protein
MTRKVRLDSAKVRAPAFMDQVIDVVVIQSTSYEMPFERDILQFNLLVASVDTNSKCKCNRPVCVQGKIVKQGSFVVLPS